MDSQVNEYDTCVCAGFASLCMIGAGRLSLIVHCISDASSCVEFKSQTILLKERWFGEGELIE